MLNGIPSLIIGNLARDPEFQTVNGKRIARISIGVTPRVKNGGNWQDAPDEEIRIRLGFSHAVLDAMRKDLAREKGPES
jgi:hypothetical protein